MSRPSIITVFLTEWENTMQNHRLTFTLILLTAVLLLAACGQAEPSATPAPTPTDTATVTATPDPCAPQNVPAEVQAIHRLMREFDDAFAVAANTPRDQMNAAVAELQRIRRAAEDQGAPACLVPLKELQLVHMNTAIQTMLAFMGGADQEAVNQGIALSRQLHNQYMIEMARLLGATLAALPSPMAAAGTPASTPEGTIAPTSSVPIVTNPGPSGVNMRAAPSLDAQDLGILGVGQSALALGRSSDLFWIMIEMPNLPGQVAWVYATLVQLEGPVETLPVITSAP